MDLDWEPGLPLSPGSLDQADQQQLLWGYPDILWEFAEQVIVAVSRHIIGEMMPFRRSILE